MVPEDVRNGPGRLTRDATPREPRVRRVLAALGLSLLVHEGVAAFWPAVQPLRKHEPPVAQIVTIVQRTPAPTPVPTPTPTPPRPLVTPTPPSQTPPPHPSFAPVVAVRDPALAAIFPTIHRTGGRAKAVILSPTPQPETSAAPVVVAMPTSAAAVVAVTSGGAGSGAGQGTGDSGLGGSGTGVSGVGTGTGGTADTAPCGSVDFVPVHTDTSRDGTQAVTVEMDVTLHDGQTEHDTLGWRWHYASLGENPFNAKNPDLPVTMQLPPSSYDVSQLKPAIAYAIRHTSPEGYLAFEACP